MTTISDRQASIATLRATLNQSATAVRKDLATEAVSQLQQSGANLGAAGVAGGDALKSLGEAALHGLGAVVNVVDSMGNAAVGTGHVAIGTGQAAAGIGAKLLESLGNVLGRALQLFGVGLGQVGNAAREVADRGGRTFTYADIQGDKFATLWSDTLLNASRDSFAAAAKSYEQALLHGLGAVTNTVEGALEVGKAAGHTLEAAVLTLAAAKDLGDAAIIKAAEGAVLASQAAVSASLLLAEKGVEYADRGVDAAGAALQQASIALIRAGNAVNTARGTDTLVRA